MKFTMEDIFIYLDYIALGEEAEEILEYRGDAISHALSKASKTGITLSLAEKIFDAIAKADDTNIALKKKVEHYKEIYRYLPEDDEITDVVIESICHRVLGEEISGEHRPANERFEISLEELFQYFDSEVQSSPDRPQVCKNIYDALLEEADRCRRLYRVLPRHEEIIDELLFAICRAKSLDSKAHISA